MLPGSLDQGNRNMAVSARLSRALPISATNSSAVGCSLQPHADRHRSSLTPQNCGFPPSVSSHQHKQDARGTRHAAAPPLPEDWMSVLRVLVIDDSLVIRGIFERMLATNRDIQLVGLASDIDQARDLVETCLPDIITLDLAMPGIGGLGFLDELASQRHAPIVVISGSTVLGSAIGQDAIARGASACFDKAKLVSDAPQLLRLLKKTVEKAKKEREKAH
jgi:two-component system chemotaxis response regulator CheB